MTIFLFILILVVLILVHETGHFIAAKLSGMRVDEFGIGFPPRLFAKKMGETEYSLNALPFGGFVKIYGENGDATEVISGQSDGNAFTDKPRVLQAIVLVAGVCMNLILAWVLLSSALMVGIPRVLSSAEAMQTPSATLMVSSVLPGTPAEKAGLKTGDTIVAVTSDHGSFVGRDPESFTAFVSGDTAGDALAISVKHANGVEETVFATPTKGVVASDPSKLALGVAVGSVSTTPVAWYKAPLEAGTLTYALTVQTAEGLGSFFAKNQKW